MSAKFLKVKIKSLAAESRIIRMEERRSTGDLRNALRNHRVQVVRDAARQTHLAYAYVRGRPAAKVEHAASRGKVSFDIKSVVTMVNRYGTARVEAKDIESWYLA